VHYPPGSGHRRSGDQRGLLTVGQQPAVARPLAWWWGCNWPTSLVLLPWGLTTASRWGRGAAPATDPPGSSRCAAGPAATGRRSPAGPDQPIGHLGWLGRAISAGEKPHPPQCLPTEDGPPSGAARPAPDAPARRRSPPGSAAPNHTDSTVHRHTRQAPASSPSGSHREGGGAGGTTTIQAMYHASSVGVCR
jgi:hypothetical protein